MLMLLAPVATNVSGCRACRDSQLSSVSVCRFLSTVEAYDPRADAWRPLTSLEAPRAYCAAATVNGVLAVQHTHTCHSSALLYMVHINVVRS